MPIIVRFPNGKVSLKKLAAAIGEPAAEKDKQDRLVEIIDNAQSDIASLCNERGCNIPSDPTFPQIINGISSITHFTKPAQVTGLRAVGAHDTANIVDLLWSNPLGDKNFTGVKILYKTGSYPSSPTDGTVAYDGAGSSVSLNNMTNGTTYYFRAFAYSSVDGGVVYNDQTTGAQCTGASTLNAPSQITSLTAIVGSITSGYVRLAWTNPSDSKFKGVRILYKTGGYPTSPTDGTVLYTGTGTSVEKTGLANGTTYYFRAFAYNLSNGIYSYNTGTTGAQCSGMPFINKGQQVFTSSGTFTVPAGVSKIDVFLVGGGAGGGLQNESPYYEGGFGGGSGCTNTYKNISVTPNQTIAVVIGAGGLGSTRKEIGKCGKSGGITSILGYAALGGNVKLKEDFNRIDGNGGSGGGMKVCNSAESFGGQGGSDGSNGYLYSSELSRTNSKLVPSTSSFCQGQKTTTRAFGESSNTLYAGGGAGVIYNITGEYGIYPVPVSGGAGGGGNSHYKDNINGENGTNGTGGGGGAATHDAKRGEAKGGNGGSGIAIVRWGY